MKFIYKTFLIIFITCSLFAQEQIRIAGYNVKRYPANNNHGTDINKVLKSIKPTILLTVELDGKDAVQQLLANALDSKYKASTEVSITWGTGNECAVFYLDSVVTYLGSSMISADTRPIGEFKFVTKTTNDTFYVFGVHLKAYPEETTRRLNSVNSLRNRTVKLKPTDNYVVVGDFNIFTSTEPGFQRLIDQTSSGYFIDMLNLNGSWNSNPAFASASTYSPSSLKTRLDMILISQGLKDNGGVDYVDNSFKIFGNDGNHFNKAVNSGSNAWFLNDASIGTALLTASDHLPIYADFAVGVPTGIEKYKTLPENFELLQNYPNPFNPETTISYKIAPLNLPKGETSVHVTLKVYDILGRDVVALVNEMQPAGFYNSQFSILNSQLATGLYFYQLKVGNFVQTKKMVVLK